MTRKTVKISTSRVVDRLLAEIRVWKNHQASQDTVHCALLVATVRETLRDGRSFEEFVEAARLTWDSQAARGNEGLTRGETISKIDS